MAQWPSGTAMFAVAAIALLAGCGAAARTSVIGGSASVTRTTVTLEPAAPVPPPAPLYIIHITPPEKPNASEPVAAPVPDPVPADKSGDGPAPGP